MISFRTWSVLALGALGIGAACSPAISSNPDVITTGSGGTSNTTSGAGGGNLVSTTSGGATSTTGSGGATVSQGAGGTQVSQGAGGTTAGETISCMATAFTIGASAYVDNGTICGYPWTASNKQGEVIDPPCGTGACFEGTTICASGTLPATDPETETYTGVMIGVNAQTGSDGTEGTWSATGKIAVTWSGGGLTGEARLMLQATDGDYCVANAKSGTSYSISQFVQECWEGGAQAPAVAAGDEIKAIVVQYNGSTAEETFTDFCITDITNQ